MLNNFICWGGMIKSKVFEVLNLQLELSGSPAQWDSRSNSVIATYYHKGWLMILSCIVLLFLKNSLPIYFSRELHNDK
jgi:hypothetical protein